MAKEETPKISQSLVGILERVRFSGANGFTVGELRIRGGELLPVVGKLFNIRLGDTLKIEGDYIQDRKFGRQFQFVKARAIFPEDDAGTVRLLERLPFVGQARAAKWVKELGYLKVLEILADPARGEELERLDATFTASRRVAMYKMYQEMTLAWRALDDLGSFALTDEQIGRALQKFGKRTIELIHEDPFLLTELRGISFVEADRIAAKMGFTPDSSVRIRGAIFYIMSEEESQGHTYVDQDDLVLKASRVLDGGWEIAKDVLDTLLSQEKGKLATSGEGRIHLRELRDAEKEIFSWLESATP
jgi:exodeoxyribonuclease V alpha subunit